MSSKHMEYFFTAANGVGALWGGVVTAVGTYQALSATTSEEKAGGALVMAFIVAGEYKLIRDTVRHYRAARAASNLALEQHA